MAARGEIRCARMVKRSQGKKKFGVVNYKDRVFVLTEFDLAYYDGSLAVSFVMKATPLMSTDCFDQ